MKNRRFDKEIGDDKLLYIPLSFLLPAVLLVIVCVVIQITPFGDHNLLISDGQFAPNYLAFLNRLLHGQENIFYSFENGLGYNYWAGFSWGGLAPTSLLIAWFCSLESMPIAFTWLVIFNLSLCGLSMYILLSQMRGQELSNLIFSTSYALMGFNAAFFFHMGFFVGVQLLPLVILGIIRIFRNKSPLLYIVSLGVSIFFNFYFGFMLCVASFAVFIACLYSEYDLLKGRKRTFAVRWLVSSIIAGLLASPLWLPAIKAFTGGGRIDQAYEMDTTFYGNMPFIQIFSKLFSGANSQSQEVNGLPNIFCGILVVALVALFFMNKEISKRRKISAGAIIGFYLLSFYIQAFTKLMHGGTHTNWFNYRYSFVFSFFLICIAAEEYRYIHSLRKTDAKKCGVAILISTILVFSTDYEYITEGAVVMDLALLAVMWLLINIHQKQPQKFSQKGLSGLLILVVSLNLFVNFTMSVKSLQTWEKDLLLYKANVVFSGSTVEALKTYDTKFFRMEKDVSESESLGIDGILYGYHGVSFSGPTVRMFYHQQLNKLGINWYDMRHWYQNGVPAATDTLLGLKYIIASRTDIDKEKSYPRIVATEENAVYLNQNALNVAVLVNDESSRIDLGSNVFENLNEIWKGMTGGDKDIFTVKENVNFSLHNAIYDSIVSSSEIEASISELKEKVSFTKLFNESMHEKSSSDTSDQNSSKLYYGDDNSNHAYIEVEFKADSTGPIYRCDMSIPESENGKEDFTVKYCGYYQEGETVKDIITTNSPYVPQGQFLEYCSHIVYANADNSVVTEYAEVLNNRETTFTVEKDTNPKGDFTAEAGQRLLFTIPWDEGWTCYIDGQPVPIEKTWDLFMSIDAPEGHHTYEMKFFPAWMNYGLYLCAAAFAGLVVLMIVWKRKNKSVPEVITEQMQIEQSAESSQLD